MIDECLIGFSTSRDVLSMNPFKRKKKKMMLVQRSHQNESNAIRQCHARVVRTRSTYFELFRLLCTFCVRGNTVLPADLGIFLLMGRTLRTIFGGSQKSRH